MRSIRIPWTAVLVVVLAAVPAWTLPREAAHPSDDTEVFTGAEETARGATPARPALGYWKVRLTLRVTATERAVRGIDPQGHAARVGEHVGPGQRAVADDLELHPSSPM